MSIIQVITNEQPTPGPAKHHWHTHLFTTCHYLKYEGGDIVEHYMYSPSLVFLLSSVTSAILDECDRHRLGMQLILYRLRWLDT